MLSRSIDFRLSVSPFAQQIVVTPSRGTAEPTSRVAQAASTVDRTGLETRPYSIVTQVLKEEVGVMAQQTTSSQGSPVLRGFTGQRNLYLLDGVRYNTAAWRDGPSQYLAWLPAADVDHIEIVRGPSSAQYGSDALGGTVGVFGPALRWSGPSPVRGTAGLSLGAANQLSMGDASAGYSHNGVSLRASASVGSVGELRPGGGVDSHSAGNAVNAASAAMNPRGASISPSVGQRLSHLQSAPRASTRRPAGPAPWCRYGFRRTSRAMDT